MALYPEHEKLHSVKENSTIISEFLEYLNTLGYDLDNEFLLHSYFDIDKKKLENERKKMLKLITNNNEY